MEREQWRPVLGWEGYYEVSSRGRIRSVERTITFTVTRKSVELKQFPDMKSQYSRVLLARNGKSINASVHILVCEAFHGPRPPGMEAAHNDGNRLNASAENLRWATKQENAFDRRAHGTHREGQNHPGAKLTEAEVREIRAAPSGRGLAKKYGVGRSAIKAIRSGRSWKGLI